MKINGWDIANADTLQWNVKPGFHSIANNSDWERGSPIPVMIENRIGFKPMTVTLLVKYEKDRQEILNRCSQIISRLLSPAELELDNFTHKFYGILSKHSLEENPLNLKAVRFNRAAKLSLEFNCYEYADAETVTFSGQTEMTVTNQGNILTPVRAEITPEIGVSSITLTGLCRNRDTGEDLPVTVGELKTGETVVLDGETGLFTQNGELKQKVEIRELPTLVPGTNKITVDSNRMDIVLKFHPRFM